MAERLPAIRLQPKRIVDWASFVGSSRETLFRAYPHASVLAVERCAKRRDATAAARVDPWWSTRRWRGADSSEVTTMADLGAGQGQLLWANMSLHGEADPQAVMRQWQHSLAVDGFVMFSTLGPGSLRALAALYAEAGWPAPFAPFVDMHDLGDMLIEAGFADPVMDQEEIELTWPTGAALLAELRQLGGNVANRRAPGLRTPRWRRQLIDLLQARANASGRIGLGFEIVYGHAFKVAPRPPLAAETAVSLDDLRAMLRAGRTRT